jgi:hypothetical protein
MKLREEGENKKYGLKSSKSNINKESQPSPKKDIAIQRFLMMS